MSVAQDAATRTWTCEACGAKFGPNDDLVCADGKSRHVVALKKYFLPGAPQQYGRDSDGKPSPKADRTLITNIPPFYYPQGWAPGCDDTECGGIVEFLNGRFETRDPEQIYWLDRRGGFCSEEEWQTSWLSPEELRELDVEKRKAELRQLEKEVEELRKRGTRGNLAKTRN